MFFVLSTILSTRFPPVRPFLASHFRTDWLSLLGLGNQVGSTTDHLLLLPIQLTERSKYVEGRADRVIANRSCWNLGTQSMPKLLITQTVLGSTWIEQKERKVCRYSCRCQLRMGRYLSKILPPPIFVCKPALQCNYAESTHSV